MPWYEYESTGESTIEEDVSECPITPDFLGDNTVVANASINIEINGNVYHFNELTGEAQVKVVGPSLKTNDNLYILTYDQKFINVRKDSE